MKLKEIHRTSTFAWSPASSIPVLLTGTVAGALDESFSNDSRLEIWSPDFTDREEYDLGGEGHPQAKYTITTASRFNRLAWGAVDSARPQGVIAAGMENGELGLWDPEKIVAKADAADAVIHKNKAHDGPVRGLDFNPIAKNLLASGATNGQIFVWDLKDPTSPYSPGGRSSRLDEITALSWNSGVQQILATSSSTGFTVVWDLRGKREVVALSYSTGSGPLQSSRKGQSAVAWHPENSTRLVTASEDDASPVIMLWDLRNARAPEKTLSGHDKGILSLSWCKQDADLLLSCGKDTRTIAWNPQSGDMIGELPAASNWAYQVEWCPRNPNILATASFDGAVGIHSIQSTNQDSAAPSTPQPSDDVFAPSYHQTFEVTMSLKQPPKWLKPPVAGSFGYGGYFVRVSNPSGTTGPRGVVHLTQIATETSIISRAKGLSEASKDTATLTALAQTKAKEATEGDESWKALISLFNSGSRDELIALLGFSKEKIADEVAKAIKALGASTPTAAPKTLPSESEETPVKQETDSETESIIKTEPEEPSLSFSDSDANSSLFGDIAGTPQADAEADFFSSMGGIRSAIPPHMQIPHSDPRKESSAAATQGSPTASTSSSEIMKSHTFDIYPEGETDVDRLVTKAIVLGDFESAVELCLSAERYADAILLAVKGGPDLLGKTQKAYFERSTTSFPYLRLYQSVAGNDLIDIVQNADLKEWQEIFVILCTYATREEFPSLTEQLGQRLEFKGTIVKSSGSDDADHKAKLLRKNATLCYLAAGNLEKIVNIWVEEMIEEQDTYAEQAEQAPKEASKYTAHAQALQTFIEKVTVFRSAVKYQDLELQSPTVSDSVAESGARTYKLAALYDRYVEYADLLATQGLLDLAVTYVSLTPKDYNGGDGADSPFHFGRERLLIAAGKQNPSSSQTGPGTVTRSTTAPAAKALPAKPPSNPYGAPSYSSVPTAAPSAYTPYGASVGNGYAAAPSNPYSTPYGQPAYGQPTYRQPQTTNPGSMVPPPPPAVNTGYTPPASTAPPPPASHAPAPLPAALRRDIPGWNDAPMVASRRTPVGAHVAAPITNPLPNSPPVQGQVFYGQMPGPGSGLAPPRTGSAGIPPPPKAGSIPPPPPASRGPSQGIPPPPPKAGSVPSHAPPPPFSQPGPGYLGGRPGSVGPPNAYDVRPPSTDPQTLNRYAPAPRADVAPEPPRGMGVPPPMSHGLAPQGPQPGQMVPPPPMRGGGPYGPPPSSMDSAQGHPPTSVPPPPRAPGGPPVLRNAPGGSALPPPPVAATPPPQHPAAATSPPKPTGPKYPPGDRSHIPDSVKGVYQILLSELENFKKIVPKRTGDDVERRMNVLFDSLNCATLSIPVVQQLLQICDAFQARDPQVALQIHLDMLTQGSRGGDDITVWMPALKQLCQRMGG